MYKVIHHVNKMKNYFEETLSILSDSVKSVNQENFNLLLKDCEKTLEGGNKIIVSGLGKNVPICEKFVGTMLSLGMNANFLHTNSAVHGDVGMVKDYDLVIILTKSGSTAESVYLVDILKQRNCKLWLLTFNSNGRLSIVVENKLVIPLEHEGDMWDIVPNNSTILNLIVLQTLAMMLAKNLNITLGDFKKNHPGGAIGEQLK